MKQCLKSHEWATLHLKRQVDRRHDNFPQVKEYHDGGLQIQCHGNRAAKTWAFAQVACSKEKRGQYNCEKPSLGGGLKHICHFPDFVAIVGVFRFNGQGN